MKKLVVDGIVFFVVAGLIFAAIIWWVIDIPLKISLIFGAITSGVLVFLAIRSQIKEMKKESETTQTTAQEET